MTLTALCQVENQMQRVMIVGGPGSGKSTLARLLGEKTGLPVFHMDHLHWKPGWEPRDDEEKRLMALEIIAKDRWVFEGGMSSTYAERLARSDTMIWLDLPFALRFWRVIKRTVRDHGKHRPDIADGCYEGFHKETLPFWWFILRTRKKNRAVLEKMAIDAGAAKLVPLQTRKDVDEYLAKLDAA